MKLFVSFLSLFFLVLASLSSILSTEASGFQGQSRDSLKSIFGEASLGPWKDGFLQIAQAPGPASDAPSNALVLGAKRTDRPDVLRGFRRYRGGWNITNRHYWFSVGFTGAAGFILAVFWFISFGFALLVHHCCGWRINIEEKGSIHSQWICLVLLLVFTCAAATGCILLSIGQNEFHGEVLHTLKYVVNQSDYTVQTLRNVTDFLSLAKTINVDQVFLPSNINDEIDKLNVDLNTAADTLTQKTSENSGKIRKVFNAVRFALITVSAVMLLLALLGLLLSLLGHHNAIYVFIFSGWLLVAITFTLCGVFVIFSNAISDTCLAMEQWVDNPQAETALSSILPCVDQRTTNHTLIKSREVIYAAVNVVNTVIYTSANSNPSPGSSSYYNQSGPLMPPLCSPFDSNLQDRHCEPQEVSLANASMVWQNYTCMVSESGLCTTVGRVTPNDYRQLVLAVNVSYALDHYAPPLLSFQNCNFVRDTFRNITSENCPPLEHHLQMVNAGLGLISVGVMLCLVLWMFYANRPLREEVFIKSLPIKFGIRRINNNGNEMSASSTPPTGRVAV